MDFTPIIPELIKQGAGYVMASFFAWFAWQLYKENRQNYKDQILTGRADVEKMQVALGAATTAQNAGTEAMKQLQKVVEAAVLTKGGRK